MKKLVHAVLVLFSLSGSQCLAKPSWEEFNTFWSSNFDGPAENLPPERVIERLKALWEQNDYSSLNKEWANLKTALLIHFFAKERNYTLDPDTMHKLAGYYAAEIRSLNPNRRTDDAMSALMDLPIELTYEVLESIVLGAKSDNRKLRLVVISHLLARAETDPKFLGNMKNSFYRGNPKSFWQFVEAEIVETIEDSSRTFRIEGPTSYAMEGITEANELFKKMRQIDSTIQGRPLFEPSPDEQKMTAQLEQIQQLALRGNNLTAALEAAHYIGHFPAFGLQTETYAALDDLMERLPPVNRFKILKECFLPATRRSSPPDTYVFDTIEYRAASDLSAPQLQEVWRLAQTIQDPVTKRRVSKMVLDPLVRQMTIAAGAALKLDDEGSDELIGGCVQLIEMAGKLVNTAN